MNIFANNIANMKSYSKLFSLISIVGVSVILYLSTLEEEYTADHDCGKRPMRQLVMKPSEELNDQFIGGSDVDPSVWPWQVSIMHRLNKSTPYRHHCGGTIIDKDWILTAAACVYKPEHRLSSNLVVKAGAKDVNTNDSNTQQIEIERIVRHKDYNPITLRHNVAILKLNTSFVFNNFVDRICIPNKINEEHPYGVCHITGYGGPPGSRILQEAEVSAMSRHTCNLPTWRNFKVAKGMFCVGGGSDGCEENLGGPVNCFLPVADQYYISGIRVYTTDCGVHQRPNIYLEVSDHFYWIERHIEDNTPHSLAPIHHLSLAIFALSAFLLTVAKMVHLP